MYLSNQSLLRNNQYLIWILTYTKPSTVEINSGPLANDSGKRIDVSGIVRCHWRKNPLRNILKTFVLNKIKHFGAPYRLFVGKKSAIATMLFWAKVKAQSVTVIQYQKCSSVYFANIASEIGFKGEYATPEGAISAHCNHLSIVKIRDACGDDIYSLNFQAVNCDCISRKLKMITIGKATE